MNRSPVRSDGIFADPSGRVDDLPTCSTSLWGRVRFVAAELRGLARRPNRRDEPARDEPARDEPARDEPHREWER